MGDSRHRITGMGRGRRALKDGVPDVEPVDHRRRCFGGAVGFGSGQDAGQPAHQVRMQPPRIDPEQPAQGR